MNQCTPEVLEAYLQEYGWSYHYVDQGQWVTGWQGQERSYPLKISVCDTWITFQIKPFVKLTIDWDSWPELSYFILKKNDDCQMVKLALDENDQISLYLEVFANGFSYQDFNDTIGLMGYYADRLYDEILSHLDTIGFRYAHALNFLT